MTYPAESVQIAYQNHVEDVRSFLDSRHADHYTVFNLSQRNYRGAKFSNRVSALHFPWSHRWSHYWKEWLQMRLKVMKEAFIKLPSSPYAEDRDE